MSDAVELPQVPELFERWLVGRPLAERSRREYAHNVRAYCAWLAQTPDRDGWQGDPLTDPLARDHAARDFRRYLQVERRAAPSTVNLALASLDALYRSLGMGRPNVRRDTPAQAAPRALDEAGQRLLLRAAEAAPIRARALVMLMLFTALRISETVALDVDDVRITTRKGVLAVMGKGEMQREVPLNALVRQVLEEWLEQRPVLAREGERALWISRTGGRLSARSADRDVRMVADRAGLELAADPAPFWRAGEVAQDELGLDQAPVVLERGREHGAALLGVESCDEQARGDGPRVQRSGEAQHLVPLLADQREPDAVAQHPAGWTVVSGPAAPDASVGQPGESWREAQAEQVEEGEDDVAVAGGVGAVDADRELAAVVEDAIEDVRRVADGGADHAGREVGVLVGDERVVREPRSRPK